QVDEKAIEPIRDRRTGGTPRRVVRSEHEMVDEELRAPSEEVCQRGAACVGLEAVRLVDPHPRQLLPPPRQLVAAPCQLLFRREQLEPRRQPLFPRPGDVVGHHSSLLYRWGQPTHLREPSRGRTAPRRKRTDTAVVAGGC